MGFGYLNISIRMNALLEIFVEERTMDIDIYCLEIMAPL